MNVFVPTASGSCWCVVDPIVRGFLSVGFLLGVSLTAQSQVKESSAQVESDLASIIKAETNIRLLSSKEFCRNCVREIIESVRGLKSILQRDPDSPFWFQIQQDLIPLQEYLAEHDLQIAEFYLSRTCDDPNGARSRLLNIIREYPNYSKTDEALCTLAVLSEREESWGDASRYLQDLIGEHPNSLFLSRAFDELNPIGFVLQPDRDQFNK
jgi:hypothetical protein